MKRSDFRFFDPMRVRWAEVDMQKIVFNGHYLMYFDTAVAAYWRALAMPYHDVMEHLQGDLYVRKATVEYLGSARYEDRCDVGLRCARIGNSSLCFVAAMFRGEKLLVHGELVYVFADPATQTSRPVPAPLRELLLAFEAGETMFGVEVQPWDAARGPVVALRRSVLGGELGLPADMMEDGSDAAAVHALAVNRFNMVVACGRLAMQGEGQARSGQISRMAVGQSVRSMGLGRAVLGRLLAEASALGLVEVRLHAQPSLVPYYAAAGFSRRGVPFDHAGLEHQEMCRTP